MKQKANLTIDERLHALAVRQAQDVHFTDLSGYVTKLIVADVRENPAPLRVRRSGQSAKEGRDGESGAIQKSA